MTERFDSGEHTSDRLMDELQLFLSLRAISKGEHSDEALRTVQAHLARLESQLAGEGEEPERFTLDEDDFNALFLLAVRQWLEPEGKAQRLAPVRWCYSLVRRLFLGTQRLYNQSVTYLLRRLYSKALLTRYYHLRSLVLEKRVSELEGRLAQLENNRDPKPEIRDSDRVPTELPSLPPEPRP